VAARRQPVERDTRARVIAAAIEEFSARGYHEASVESIAERAGVTKGAVYYWFRDKADLANDVLVEIWERLGNEAALALDPDGDPVGNLKAAFRTFLGSLQDLGEARFFLREGWAVPELDQAGRQEHEMGIQVIRAALEPAAADADAGVVEAAAHVLSGAFAEATLHILTTGEAEPTLQVVEHVIDALVRSLEGSPA
jgi:AcrR family transcriptional regulator